MNGKTLADQFPYVYVSYRYGILIDEMVDMIHNRTAKCLFMSRINLHRDPFVHLYLDDKGQPSFINCEYRIGRDDTDALNDFAREFFEEHPPTEESYDFLRMYIKIKLSTMDIIPKQRQK